MNSPTFTSYSFRHVERTTYHVLYLKNVDYVVVAYGKNTIVVDKHKTAMLSKATTNTDRFERVLSSDDGSPTEIWIRRDGPHRGDTVGLNLTKILNQIAEHHENYLAKLILE